MKHKPLNYSALDFFAGSGLVSYALRPEFSTIWANDICEKKGWVYTGNHGFNHFRLGAIECISGYNLPPAHLSWASFPCQDLSLAGANGGINASRSGLVWEWLRIMDEMSDMPSVLVAENVLGLISSNRGRYYRVLHEELVKRKYIVGAVVLDAVHWLPQSRPRVFVIAVKEEMQLDHRLISQGPCWSHNSAISKVAEGLPGWVWWKLPPPPKRTQNLVDVIEHDAAFDTEEITKKNISLLSPRHFELLNSKKEVIATGYKRTRNGRQMLELRFDGIAGCLRTPGGGSSRQLLVIKRGNDIQTRLLTARETARLMGAPDSYLLPGTYNDGYKAMGDAVAVPVVRFLTENLLYPLASQATSISERS